MNRTTSVNLDLARWLAAMAVFTTHFVQLGMDGTYRAEIEPLGRVGVVFFFVLSGYVISATAQEKHGNMVHYMAARLGRLQSVFLPAIVLTWIADSIGRTLDPSIYARFPEPLTMKAALSAPLMVTFLYENSIFSTRWLSNSPMWSIAYEFWYYFIFGASLFYKGSTRVLLIIAGVALAGWKILLLSPIWALGVWIHRNNRSTAITFLQRMALMIACISLIAVIISPRGHEFLKPLRDIGKDFPPGYHSSFAADAVIALPIGLLVWLLSNPLQSGWSPMWTRVIQSLAGGSFALYLFHLPLVLLLKSTSIYNPGVWWQGLLAALVTLVMCHSLSKATEAQKQPWVRLMEKVLLRAIPLQYRGKNERSRI